MNKKTKGKQTGKQTTLDADALYESAMGLLCELDLYVDGYLEKRKAIQNIETLRHCFRFYDKMLMSKLTLEGWEDVNTE